MSCFVTERKHRDIKASALHVFRHYEHTVLCDCVAKQLDHLCDDALYQTMALVHEVKVTAGGVEMLRSKAARFPCGEVNAGDFVFLADRSVAQVEDFWSTPDRDNFVVQARPLVEVSAGHSYGRCGAAAVFLDAAEIREPLVWAERRPGVYRVCQTFSMLKEAAARASGS